MITTQPISPTNHGRIDSNPQISVTPITLDPHNVLIESETSSKNALWEEVFNETLDDVLADPKVNPSIKEGLSRVTSILSTFMSLTSPLFDRNKTPTNTNDVETGTNATVNSINNPNHEQSETIRNEEINKYQTQID